MDVNDLEDSYLDCIHRDAEPLERRDVTPLLRPGAGVAECSPRAKANRAIADIVQAAQKRFNRSLSRAVPAKG